MESGGGSPRDDLGARAGMELNRRGWPAWSRARGYASLAEYVATPDVLDGLRLEVERPDDEGRSPAEVDRQIAAGLYELLRAKELRYTREKRFVVTNAQQVRDPRQLIESGFGNCLDFASAYATACMAAHVDVLLAVIPGHAFVVLTPGRAAKGEPRKAFELTGFAANAEQGVLEGDVGTLISAAAQRAVTLVEVSSVINDDDFESAAEFDPTQENWSASDPVRLIDVPMLQATGTVLPLPPPAARAIRRYVPSGGVGFRAYTGDGKLIDRLRRASGPTALWAKSGQGKSMIARHLVEEEPTGAAWFLDASEPQALINSLASAALNEENRHDENLDDKEREALAFTALARLREAEGSWLVVLDNADGDPPKLRKWLPIPGEGQRVLVTTTNEEWEQMPGFALEPLGDVAESEVRELGSAELVPLVRGRRLMLEAFRQLLAGCGLSGTQVAGYAAQADEEDPESVGPSAFWEALRESDGFGEDELRLSALASFLPPDHQPRALLAAAVGEAAPVLALLEERGLLTADEATESIRMHRLFGAAIRRFLDAERPELRDEVVFLLTTRGDARAVLDRYGDLATVSRLDERLAAIDAETAEPDPQLGSALHGIAGLLERFGQVRRSGETYRLAQRHLAADPKLVADCLQGRARTINQHHKREPGLLRQAVEWAREARRIQSEPGGERTNADRCLAMEGLLTKALAQFPEPGETTIEILHQALSQLEEADERRRDDDEVSEEEKARSFFNLAGIRIDLAKAEREHAKAHLDEAERVYEETLRWRKRLYKCDVHPHIAACEAGLGYVGYYRATLIPASQPQRSFWLRQATDHTVAALKQWETLDGSVDLEEAPKSARFLAKVALARHASPAVPDGTPKGVVRETMKELTDGRIVFETIRPLPADGDGVAAGIEAWARSVALAELVGLFDGELPGELELPALLAWLEEFSARWDYRGGKERNLVRASALEPVTEKVVKAAAAALGLVKGGARPSGAYDHMLILGGLARACLARPLHAAKLLREGKIETGSVTALGGYRELKGDELGLVESVTGEHVGGEAVADEFEAMDAGVRHAFELGQASEGRGEELEGPGASWRVRDYTGADGMQINVVAAPSGEPGKRRTNTADSFEWFAGELVEVRPGQRLLMVTTDIYVPYQHADVLRVIGLPREVTVDTVGIQTGEIDPRLSYLFAPHAYLQEVRSTILAFNRLLESTSAPAG